MIVSIITDSLSLGRIDYDKNKIKPNVKVHQYECWPWLISKSHQVYINAKRERTTDYLITEDVKYESIDLVNPDCIIIQIGVVDCAPRVISLFEKRILNLWAFPKFIRNRIIKDRSARRNAIQEENPLKKVYVEPQGFINNISTFVESNQHIKIIAIPILCDNRAIDKTSIGFSSNVKRYNNILANLSIKYSNLDYVDSLESMNNQSEFFCMDGYHLTAHGHGHITNNLLSLLDKRGSS